MGAIVIRSGLKNLPDISDLPFIQLDEQVLEIRNVPVDDRNRLPENIFPKVITSDIDKTGQGAIGFTGNFLKFDNAGSTNFTVASTGNLTTAGDVAVNGGDFFKWPIGRRFAYDSI